MGQWFKKVTLSLTAASVIATSFAVPFASAADIATGDPVVWNYDFESSSNFYGATGTPSVEHTGKAQKYDKHSKATNDEIWGSQYMNGPTFASTGSGATLANSNTSTAPYVVSFDFMLTSTKQNYKYMLRDWSDTVAKKDNDGNPVTNNQGNQVYETKTNDFAFINFVDGKIMFDKTAAGAAVYTDGFNNSNYDAGTYEANKWYNIAIYVTPGEKGASTVDYYLDGQLKCQANASGRAASNGILYTSYLGVLTTKENGNPVAPTAGEFWIDNYNMQYADSAYYTALTNSAPKVSNNTITVDFIESICTDGYEMGDIKLYDSKNSEVSGATATVSGKTLKITGATLTNGEYHIALPSAFKGVSGVTPQMDVISFVNGEEVKTSGDVAWVVNNTGDYTNGFTSSDSNLTTEDVEGNKVFKFTAKDSGQGGWDAGNYEVKYPVNSNTNFKDSDYNLSDKIVVSSDYYFPSTNGKIDQTGLIRCVLQNSNPQCRFIGYKFTSNNKLIFYGEHANKEAFSVNVKPNVWYTIKTVTDKSAKTTDCYVQEKGGAETYVGTTTINNDWAAESSINIVYPNSGNKDGDKHLPGNYYIDNIKVGYQTNYTKMLNEQTGAPVATYTLPTELNLADGKSYCVDFDVTVDSLAGNRDIFIPVKGGAVIGKENEVHNDTKLVFRVDTEGNLKMMNSIINDWTTDYEYDLKTTVQANKAFNIKLYIDKSKPLTENVKDVCVFIDDVFVRSFQLSWGREDWGAPWIGCNDITGVTGSANAKISNFKLGYTSKIPYIESAVIYNQNDNMGHAFVSQNIKSDIEKLVLNVADASYATNGTLTAGTAKLTNGTSEIELNSAVDGSKIVLTTKNGAYVPNGKWTLNYTGSNDCGDYTADFTVNETRTLVDNSKLSVTGTNAELTGTIQNFAAEKTVSVIIAEYSADNPKRLVNVFTKDVKLQSGTNTLSELKLTGSTDNKNNYKAFIWETIAGMAPVFSAKTAE